MRQIICKISYLKLTYNWENRALMCRRGTQNIHEKDFYIIQSVVSNGDRPTTLTTKQIKILRMNQKILLMGMCYKSAGQYP